MKKYEDERRERGLAVFSELRRLGIAVPEPTEAQLHFFGDGALYADIQAGQDMQWIRAARNFAEKLVEGNPTFAQVSLFWIRAAGLFLDIAPHYRASLDSALRAFGELPDVPSIRLTQALLAAIEAVATSLPDDELLYLEYRRHVECHPRQGNYRAKLHKDGSLRPIKSKALGAVLEQSESEDTLRAVLLRYGGDEGRAAVEIARKVLEPLRAVEAAAQPLCEAT